MLKLSTRLIELWDGTSGRDKYCGSLLHQERIQVDRFVVHLPSHHIHMSCLGIFSSKGDIGMRGLAKNNWLLESKSNSINHYN